MLDHHQVGGPLPVAVAVVNPNREDDLSGQGHLCAAGVVFLALVQTARLLRIERPDAEQPDLLALLDLVALATVCDVVPLTGVNRAFVVKGLLAARQQRNAGLAALARVSRIGEPINTFHLSFLIGPRINAGGRIGDAALGSRLLATDDPVEAGQIAETLDRLNQERQAMEQGMLAEARAEADAELAGGAGPAIVVTASENWHPGIVGLLASRLKEHARRPAFAIAFNPNGVGTGSGRSVTGFDLGRLVREAAAEGLIVKGGGHAMAAGITVERDKLGALRAFFEERAAAEVFRLQDEEVLDIDAALAAEGATLGAARGAGEGRAVRRRACRAGFRAAAAPAGGCAAGRRQPYPRRSAVRRRRAHPGDRLPRGGHGARRFPVQQSRARRCTSPDRCRAATGTAIARWISA